MELMFHLCSPVGFGPGGETFTNNQPLIHDSLNCVCVCVCVCVAYRSPFVSVFVHFQEEELLTEVTGFRMVS